MVRKNNELGENVETRISFLNSLTSSIEKYGTNEKNKLFQSIEVNREKL